MVDDGMSFDNACNVLKNDYGGYDNYSGFFVRKEKEKVGSIYYRRFKGI